MESLTLLLDEMFNEIITISFSVGFELIFGGDLPLVSCTGPTS